MNRLLFFALIFFTLIASNSCRSQSSGKDKSNKGADIDPRISKQYDSTKVEKYFPFIVYNNDRYMIAAEIESKELYDKYLPVFEKYNYSGNGYSWEGHIKQILQKEKPGLLKHLDFDPEAGGFYVYADSREIQKQFAELMSKIFSDINKLESYLKSADRSKIDD